MVLLRLFMRRPCASYFGLPHLQQFSILLLAVRAAWLVHGHDRTSGNSPSSNSDVTTPKALILSACLGHLQPSSVCCQLSIQLLPSERARPSVSSPTCTMT